MLPPWMAFGVHGVGCGLTRDSLQENAEASDKRRQPLHCLFHTCLHQNLKPQCCSRFDLGVHLFPFSLAFEFVCRSALGFRKMKDDSAMLICFAATLAGFGRKLNPDFSL